MNSIKDEYSEYEDDEDEDFDKNTDKLKTVSIDKQTSECNNLNIISR